MKKQLSVLTALLAALIAAFYFTLQDDKVSIAVGKLSISGQTYLAELHQPDSKMPYLHLYGSAPHEFDYLVTAPLALTDIRRTSTGFQGQANFRGSALHLEVRTYGNVWHLTHHQGDPQQRTTSPFLKGVATSADELTRFTGLYEREGRQFLVTFREYGGLRLIDMADNTNRNLYYLDDQKFLLMDFDTSPENAPLIVSFVRRDNDILALHIDKPGRSTAFMKAEGTQQHLFAVERGNYKLAGTMFGLESKPGPKPGLVLVHGSGPIYRTALAARAMRLAGMGLVVAAFDKRGTGASSGRYNDDDYANLAADAAVVLDHMEKLDAVDSSRTGFQGHSQAGYVIPLAVTMSDKADFAIIANGGSIPPIEQSLFDKKNDLKRAGFSEADSRQALTLMRDVFDYVLKGEDPDESLSTRYQQSLDIPWFPVTDLPRLDALPRWSEDDGRLEAYRKHLSFDPLEAQSRMSIPVLVLLGTADETVSSKRAAVGWRESSNRSASPATIHFIEGADHGMRVPDAAGDRVIAPEYWMVQQKWLSDILGGADFRKGH